MPTKILSFAKHSTRPNTRNEAKRAEKFIPSFSTDKPVKPKGGSKEEEKHFVDICARLDDIGLNSKTFDPLIITLAKNMALSDRIRKEIETKKLFSGPIFAALRIVETQIRTSLKEMGLTPAAHSGIGKRRAADPSGSASIGDWGDV